MRLEMNIGGEGVAEAEAEARAPEDAAVVAEGLVEAEEGCCMKRAYRLIHHSGVSYMCERRASQWDRVHVHWVEDEVEDAVSTS